MTGVLGAIAQIKSSQGYSAIWPFLAGMISVALWANITKFPMVPWVAALVYDVVYSLSWMIALYFLGSTPTWTQLIGGILAITGIIIAAK